MPASSDVVSARDRAILSALKLRPWPEEGLFTVLPDEGLSIDQAQVALKSALIRLRIKKQIVQEHGTWRVA